MRDRKERDIRESNISSKIIQVQNYFRSREALSLQERDSGVFCPLSDQYESLYLGDLVKLYLLRLPGFGCRVTAFEAQKRLHLAKWTKI